MRRFVTGVVSCLCLLASRAAAEGQGLMVTQTDPLEGATGVPTDAVVRVYFDRELNPVTIGASSILASDLSTPQDLQPTWELGTSVIQNDMLVITFGVLPGESAQVEVRLDATIGATDASTLGTEYVLHYTTAEPFHVTWTTPSPGDTNVYPQWMGSITFDRPLDPGSVNPTTVWAIGEKDEIPRTFAVTITVYGSMMEVRPENIQPKLGESVTITVSTGVKSGAGEPLPQDYVLTFRTLGRPYVMTTWPNEYTPLKDVGRDVSISIMINPWYDPNTANTSTIIVTSKAEGGELTGLEIKPMGTSSIEIYHPPFDPLDSITVELTDGITADGEPLVPYTFRFQVREFEPIRIALESVGYFHSIGGSVVVPVRILDDVTGRGITAFQFRVTFDSTVVRLDSVSIEGTMPQTVWSIDSLEVGRQPGEVYVSWAVFELGPELTGTGLLARLHFTHIGGPTWITSLNLSDVDGIFFNEGDPGGRLDVQLTGLSLQFAELATVSGAVTYAESGVPVDSVWVYLKMMQFGVQDSLLTGPDGTFFFPNVPEGQVEIRVEAVRNDGIDLAISATDASYVLQTVVRKRELSPLVRKAADVTHNGQVAAYDASRILGYRVGTVPDFGPQWWFLDIMGNGPQAELYVPTEGLNVGVEAVIAGDVTANWEPAHGQPAKVAAGPPRALDLSVRETGTWSLHMAAGDPVFAAEVEMRSAEPLAIAEVTAVEGWLVAWRTDGNTVRIAVAGSEPITDPTELLTIRMANGVLPTFERVNVVLNEGTIPAEVQINRPHSLALHPAVPNPFNPSTQLSYELPEETAVYMTVVNALGQHVRTLVNERMAPGAHRVTWNAQDDRGRDVASGVYIVSLRAGDKVLYQRMLLVR